MRLMKLKSPFWSLLVAALLLSLPFLGSEAQAQRRGGGGGYSGGSFRGGGGYATGPRGGAVAVGPRGGAVAEGPRGGVAARGPAGGAVAAGPRGGTAYRGGAYYGPGYRPLRWRSRKGGGLAVGAWWLCRPRPQPGQWRVRPTIMTAAPITSRAIRVLTSITAWSRSQSVRGIARGTTVDR